MNIVTHKLSGIKRALKTIKKKDLPKEDESKLFSEMNLLKTLDHPNIIKMIELYQDNLNYYLITEYAIIKRPKISQPPQAHLLRTPSSAFAFLRIPL